VKQAANFYREHGRDALLADINSLSKGRFLDRDLYLMAINLSDEKFVAHGNNLRVLGHGGTGSKDVDGKLFVVEMARVARTAGQGWVEYKWAHPITNEIKVKNSYVERVGDLAVICGIYKQ
jgi:signal transduction histidine kinase